MQLAKDLLHPSPEEEKRRHKKKRLVQSPNSYFMDVKCPGTFFFSYLLIHRSVLSFSTDGMNPSVYRIVMLGFLFFFLPQDATRSRQCSATLRQSCCVLAVQQSCVSPLEAKHVSQRVSINLPNTVQLQGSPTGGFEVECIRASPIFSFQVSRQAFAVAYDRRVESKT